MVGNPSNIVNKIPICFSSPLLHWLDEAIVIKSRVSIVIMLMAHRFYSGMPLVSNPSKEYIIYGLKVWMWQLSNNIVNIKFQVH